MEAIYSVLETIIPFEFINYTFMKNQRFWHIQNKKKNTISKTFPLPSQ